MNINDKCNTCFYQCSINCINCGSKAWNYLSIQEAEDVNAGLKLYCKEFPEHTNDKKWCGVIVNFDRNDDRGVVIDAIFMPSSEELKDWFVEYKNSK